MDEEMDVGGEKRPTRWMAYHCVSTSAVSKRPNMYKKYGRGWVEGKKREFPYTAENTAVTPLPHSTLCSNSTFRPFTLTFCLGVI